MLHLIAENMYYWNINDKSTSWLLCCFDPLFVGLALDMGKKNLSQQSADKYLATVNQTATRRLW